MTPISPSAIASAPELPGFEWVRPLGSGGFADVHLYHQLLPSRDVAIKVVRSLNDERGAAELRREANAMTAVAGHPAIVPLHGAGTAEDGRPFLVMEYCPVADVGEHAPCQSTKLLTLWCRLAVGLRCFIVRVSCTVILSRRISCSTHMGVPSSLISGLLLLLVSSLMVFLTVSLFCGLHLSNRISGPIFIRLKTCGP